ncbi:MAG: DUF3488 and transglutaminase-like domain-containing protein [Gammaproteobacteria bacterium]|nr:DUF3488 and transglutaminase-like domain-containing protein [Gammaproteobacteria bacterium]
MKTVLLQELDTPPGHQPLKLTLLALGLLFVPHWFIFNPLLTAALYATLAWRWFALNRSHAMPPAWMRVLLALTAFVAILGLYGNINGPEPGMALLSIMVVLKLTEVRRVRDALMVVVLGYFIIFASFLYSQEIPHVVMQTPSLLFLTAALLVLGHNKDDARGRKVLKRAGRLSLQAIPFAILLFLLFPRIPGPLWGVPSAGGDGISGLDDRMTPGSISNLVLSEDIAFRVRFENQEDIPLPWNRYWRGPTLHLFNGQSWWRGFATIQSNDNFELRGDPVRYTVMQEPTNQGWLFALPMAAEYPRTAVLTRDFTLTSRRPLSQRQQYRMTSYLDYVMSPELSSLEERWGLQLPDTGNARTREMIATWKAEGLTNREIVSRALNFFSNEPFYYTLQPERLDRDPIDQFLFETREGFCEHYASAFTFMMRVAGIPSRVVTGYQGGELNELSGFLIIKQSDAHAWVEVWYEDQGWTRVDPTAAVAPDRIEFGINAALAGEENLPGHLGQRFAGDFLTELEISWEALNGLWNEFFLGYGPEMQQNLMQALGMENPDWTKLALWLFGLLALGGLLLAALLAWQARPPATDLPQRVYLRLRRRLDPDAPGHEGPRDFFLRMEQQHPEVATELRRFMNQLLTLRYTGTDNEDVHQLRQLARQITRGTAD